MAKKHLLNKILQTRINYFKYSQYKIGKYVAIHTLPSCKNRIYYILSNFKLNINSTVTPAKLPENQQITLAGTISPVMIGNNYRLQHQ